MKKGFDISISALSTKLWKETTVDELLFSGYEDTLINLARSMPQLKNLPIPDYDRFGWFYKVNIIIINVSIRKLLYPTSF